LGTFRVVQYVFCCCRDADKNCNGIGHAAQSSDNFGSCSDAEIRHEDVMTTDSAAATPDCYIQLTDDDLEPSHDHQYTTNLRKRFVLGPFLCDRCGYLLAVWHELCEHIRRFHRSKATDDLDDDRSASPLPCTNTEAVISHIGRKKSVSRRLEKTSRNDEAAVCHICGWVRTEDSQSLASHVRNHAAPIYVKCRYCSLKMRRNNLRRHEMLHAAVRRFLCQHCARNFQQKDSLVAHISKYHADKADGAVSDTASKPSFRCRHCDGLFRSPYHVRKHKLLQHPMTVRKKCGSPVSSCKQHSSRGAAHYRAFGCSICSVSYTSAVRLNQHMLIHGTNFASDVASVYRCQLCSEQFAVMNALVEHAADIHHIVEPEYSCGECGRFFRVEAMFKQHMRIHSDDAFTCAVCSKKFELKCALEVHMASHDKAHAKFACSTCGKRFKTKQMLSFHEHIHSGTKPYVCSLCTRAFRQPQHLTQHFRTHTNTKPYRCSHCDREYKNRIDLRNHCTRVHNVELPVLRKPKLQDTQTAG